MLEKKGARPRMALPRLNSVGPSQAQRFQSLTRNLPMLIDDLRTFLADYFEVLQTQDMALFDRVFHKDCVLYSQQDGQLVVRPFAVYREMVQGRQSPASGGFPRDEQILTAGCAVAHHGAGQSAPAPV
jgi:hypothetical protein